MKILSLRSVRYLPVILAVLMAFLFTAPSSQAASKNTVREKKPIALKLSDLDLIRMTTLLTAAHHFREAVQKDYGTALLAFATDEVIRKFRIFDEKIWIQTAPLAGWSYFMSVSVHTVGRPMSKHPLVAFYNPWSDVFLITVWDMAGEVPRIVDAEMILGDWFRRDSVLSYKPAWLKSDLFKPASLGVSLGETVKSFENTFSDISDDSWRDTLLVLNDQQLLKDINYPLIAVRLYSTLKAMDDFRFAGKNNPRMESCHKLTLDTVKSASKGRMASLVQSATATHPTMKNILRSMDPAQFQAMEAVAAFTGRDGCLVFLAPVHDAPGSISLFFEGQTKNMRLKRMDVIDYSGFYNHWQGMGTPSREIRK